MIKFSKLFTLIPIILFLPFGYCYAEDDQDKTQITSVSNTTLVSVDFFEAKIELEFYYPDDPHGLFIGVFIPDLSMSQEPVPVKKGNNKYTLYANRDLDKEQKLRTKNISLVTFRMDGRPVFQQPIDLEINWPGPEYAETLIQDKKTDKPNLLKIENIAINRDLESSDDIIKALLANGYPISKIITNRPEINHPVDNNIVLSNKLEFESIKELLNTVLNELSAAPLISFKENYPEIFDPINAFHPVTIGSPFIASPSSRLSESDFNKLKDSNLTLTELTSILNIKLPTREDKIQQLYHQAYNLLDRGYKTDLKKAKALLDELISLNPDFPRAYLELARYHMKSNWPVGLVKAEKLIQMAKEIDPNLADTRVLLGYVYTFMGKFGEADKELQLAEKLGTNNLWLYANWGLNFEKQNQHAQAIDKYLKVLYAEKNSERDDRPKTWVYLYSKLFDMLIEEKKYKLADQLYEKSAADYSNHSCELQKQAELRLFHMHNPDAAIDSYLRSKKSGCNKESYIISASYFLKWKLLIDNKADKKTIQSTLRQAESLVPEDDQLFYGLAKSAITAELISKLKDMGHNINYVNKDGMTALLNSIAINDLKAAEILINNGAQINQKTLSDYFIPIVYAIYNKNTEMVKLLIRKKAKTNVKIADSLTLPEFAKQLGFEKIHDILTKTTQI